MRCYSCQLSAGDQADTWHNQISYYQPFTSLTSIVSPASITRGYLDIYMEQYLDSYQLTITRNIYNIYTDHQQQHINSHSTVACKPMFCCLDNHWRIDFAMDWFKCEGALNDADLIPPSAVSARPRGPCPTDEAVTGGSCTAGSYDWFPIVTTATATTDPVPRATQHWQLELETDLRGVWSFTITEKVPTRAFFW